MLRLWKRNELQFSLVWIALYVAAFSAADSLSTSLGTEKIITAPVAAAFTLVLFGFVRRNGLQQTYGLCAFQGEPKRYLYFLPLLLIMSTNLWNGAAMRLSALETTLHLVTMLCVGFIEELLFRGFLFKALCRDNVRSAVIVSSLTFGIGHIVNLLSGRELIPTLLQICCALALGLLFTILFYRGKSLVPCILVHSVVNATSVFGIERLSWTGRLLSILGLCAIALGYSLWILKKTPPAPEKEQPALQQ